MTAGMLRYAAAEVLCYLGYSPMWVVRLHRGCGRCGGRIRRRYG